MEQRRYWIVVLAQDRVELARAGGYVQPYQARASMIERLREGDGLPFYSPRSADPKGEPVQAFTALAHVTGADGYRAELPYGSVSIRVRVDYAATHVAPVKPLLDQLRSFAIARIGAPHSGSGRSVSPSMISPGSRPPWAMWKAPPKKPRQDATSADEASADEAPA
jgi:hypothetical protein